MNEVRDLKDWLKQPGNSTAKLAAKLGYRSSTTIAKWLERGAVPSHMVGPLRKILKQKGSGL